jgi:hypothetical protein
MGTETDAGYKVKGSYNNLETTNKDRKIPGIFTNNKKADDFGEVEEWWDNEVEIGKEMESKQRELRRQWRDRWFKDTYDKSYDLWHDMKIANVTCYKRLGIWRCDSNYWT